MFFKTVLKKHPNQIYSHNFFFKKIEKQGKNIIPNSPNMSQVPTHMFWQVFMGRARPGQAEAYPGPLLH